MVPPPFSGLQCFRRSFQKPHLPIFTTNNDFDLWTTNIGHFFLLFYLVSFVKSSLLISVPREASVAEQLFIFFQKLFVPCLAGGERKWENLTEEWMGLGICWCRRAASLLNVLSCETSPFRQVHTFFPSPLLSLFMFVPVCLSACLSLPARCCLLLQLSASQTHSDSCRFLLFQTLTPAVLFQFSSSWTLQTTQQDFTPAKNRQTTITKQKQMESYSTVLAGQAIYSM